MHDLIYVILAVGVVGILEGLFFLRRYVADRKRDELARRLGRLGNDGGVPQGGLLRTARFSNIPVIDSILRGVEPAVKLERLLEQAGVDMTVARLVVYTSTLATAGFGLGIMLQMPLPLAMMLGLLGLAAPLLWVLSVRSARSDKSSAQLPEALDMLARALRAGYAVNGACRLVATEMPEPINIEFGKAYEEQRLGFDLDKALVRMTERVPSNGDLRIFAVSVTVQKETGGNLAELLEQISATIRDRFRFFGKLRGLTAEGRISGLVLSVLPLGMALFMALKNPSYLRVLAETPMGNALLAYGVLSWIGGIFWMHRMTKVEL
jgi:tight adherence protein B